MKFSASKREEAAIICLLLEKQNEYVLDNSKTFEDGIKFGYLSTEAIFYYRCLKELKFGTVLHTGAQQTVDHCNNFVKYFGLEHIFDIDYISNNCSSILCRFEDAHNININIYNGPDSKISERSDNVT